jgi:hypothetical protein
MMVEWRPKHVGANKLEKGYTTGAFVGLSFNNNIVN